MKARLLTLLLVLGTTMSAPGAEPEMTRTRLTAPCGKLVAGEHGDRGARGPGNSL